MSYCVRTKCRVCDNRLHSIFCFPEDVPLAGGFLRSSEEKETYYPLTLTVCSQCWLMQCQEVVSSNVLFHDAYFYRSSMIKALCSHFDQLAHTLVQKYPPPRTVLEIGCNDGVLLTRLHRLGYKVIGVDPATDLVRPLQQQGYSVYAAMFTPEVARDIVSTHGRVDLFLSSNSFAHIDDMGAVIEAMKIVMKPCAAAVLEVHYSKRVVDKRQFDFVYHEHMSYYTATSLRYLVEKKLGMCLHEVQLVPLHGTSMRAFVEQHSSIHPAHSSVTKLIQEEHGLASLAWYRQFVKNIKEWQTQMQKLIASIQCQHPQAVFYGYGASGRANTLCALFPFPLTKVIDDAPSKIGCFMPKSKWPIVSADELYTHPPDYIVILAWPYASSIIQAHANFHGQFIVPLPAPHIA